MWGGHHCPSQMELPPRAVRDRCGDLLDLKQVNCSCEWRAPIERFGNGPRSATGSQALTTKKGRQAVKSFFQLLHPDP